MNAVYAVLFFRRTGSRKRWKRGNTLRGLTGAIYFPLCCFCCPEDGTERRASGPLLAAALCLGGGSFGGMISLRKSGSVERAGTLPENIGDFKKSVIYLKMFL